MTKNLKNVLTEITNQQRQINCLYFANNQQSAPLHACQVDFPRIELIIEGEQFMQWADSTGKIIERQLVANDLVYITANSWNKHIRTTPITWLSILYGKQQIGISVLHWDGSQLIPKGQISTPRRGPRIGTFIIHALSELTWQNQPQNQTSYYLIQSLLSNTLDLLNTDIKTASKTTSLFEAIRQYIDTHFRENISREFLAKMFYISPNYLSYLFQNEGKIGLNEYLNHIRLEYSKSLLKGYELNVKEIALDAGFKDSNYFCRIFRKKTERTPTEYRRQYHSKLSKQ